MSDNLERICTVDISLASPISNNANFDTVLILGPAPMKPEAELPLIGAYSSLEELTSLGVLATGDGADPIGVAARVAFSQSPRPREVYVACMGEKPRPNTTKISIPRQSQSLNLGSVIVSDIIGTDVRVLDDGTVLGTLKRIESWPEFSGSEDEQKGNYFPVLLPAGGKKLKTTKGVTVKDMDFPNDRLLVIRVPDTATTCKIEVDEQELITLNFSKATLLPTEPAPVEIPTVPVTVSDILETALATNGWYCICPVGLGDDEVREVIQWAETQNKLCGYIDQDPENPLMEPGLYLRSYPAYPKVTEDQLENDIPQENRYGMAVAMAVKAMNFHAGEETWALKQLATVTPSKPSTTLTKKLEAANFSYVITVASKNVTQGGKTNGGEWIDVIRFRDWLQNDMQVRVVNLLVVNPKIPYTDNGIGLVENQMLASLKDGQKYGGIAPTEYDANGTAIPGYVTQVPLSSELTSTQKASRVLTDCRFSARLAGAIHMVEIKGCLTYETL